jgi:hypothetical protein
VGNVSRWHAIWSGCVGILLYRNQEGLQGADEWYELLLTAALIVAGPMILHGLYATLLKRDMELWALAAALASFLWLAWLIESSRGDDAE